MATTKGIRVETVKMITVSDWDDLVKRIYGRQYSLQQQDGCKPRGIVHITVPDEAEDYDQVTVPEIVNHDEMGVSFSAWLKRDPKKPLEQSVYDKIDIDLWWDRNFYPDIQMVANDLHTKGLLESGDYIIDIDW